ncbi:MAG: hypothetical protein ABW252_09550, partial [Polyangiales bacterium]
MKTTSPGFLLAFAAVIAACDASDAASPHDDAVIGAQVAASDAGAETCAASGAYRVGENRITLQHGGRARQVVVYVPRGADAKKPVPLVLDFHGNGSSAAQEAGGSGWRQKADQEGFVVAFPQGVGNGWN